MKRDCTNKLLSCFLNGKHSSIRVTLFFYLLHQPIAIISISLVLLDQLYVVLIVLSQKGSPLQLKDERIRGIPFSTKRPSHTEVQRVYSILSSIQFFKVLEKPQSTQSL